MALSLDTTAFGGAGQSPPALLTVAETAKRLNVSESWVRRHIAELPVTRVGRLIRIDSALLSEKLQGTMKTGNSLKSERATMPSRYQRGTVFTRGKKKVWYGFFREDVRTVAGTERRSRLVRLGTPAELPTKNSARNKLAEMLSGQERGPVAMDMTFDELADRWRDAEGPTLKQSTLNAYTSALRAYVRPAFGKRKITSINREDIQRFLVEQAQTYSLSTLRSTKVSLGLTLGWAEACGWIAKSPCFRLKLPKETGGRRVTRTVLTPERIAGIASKLEEPYATLVFFLASTGLRIGEAIAVKWSDIDNNVLTVARRIFDGNVDAVKSIRSVRRLPLDADLVERLRSVLQTNREWLFCSEAGTPVNPGNALKRYVRPAATECGITLGGWHDFRHTLSTTLRKAGVHPKVLSDLLGHSKVNIAMDVYDRTDVRDYAQPLAAVSTELLSNAIKLADAA